MKKNILKYCAIAQAGMLSVALSSVGVFADDSTSSTSTAGVTSVPIEETTTAASGVTLPTGLSYTYTLVPDSSRTYADDEYLGVADGLTISAASAASEDDSTTQTTNIEVDASKFTQPGIYYYTLTENKGDIDGVDYSTTNYTLAVYVDNAKSGSGLVVSGVVAYANGSTTKSSTITFDNTYNTQTLTLTKEITGDQADTSQTFEFNITVSGENGQTFHIIQNGQTIRTLTADTDTVTLSLGNDDSITIDGLTTNDTWTIQEPSANTDGYTTTITSSVASDKIDNSKGTITGDGAKDDAITYTNNRSTTTPTGFVQAIWPYAVMIGIGAALIALFAHKGRKHSED